MLATQEIHKSRWGYHPCDYHTFVKLKEIHKYFWKTVRDSHRWKRWDRKTVYQSPNEPKVCPYFLKGKHKHPFYLDWTIREDYQNARYARGKVENVKPLSMTPEEIGELVVKVRAWFNEN